MARRSRTDASALLGDSQLRDRSPWARLGPDDGPAAEPAVVDDVLLVAVDASAGPGRSEEGHTATRKSVVMRWRTLAGAAVVITLAGVAAWIATRETDQSSRQAPVAPETVSFESQSSLGLQVGTPPAAIELAALRADGSLVLLDLAQQEAEVWSAVHDYREDEDVSLAISGRIAIFKGESEITRLDLDGQSLDPLVTPPALVGTTLFPGPDRSTVWLAGSLEKSCANSQLGRYSIVAGASPAVVSSDACDQFAGLAPISIDGRGEFLVKKDGEVWRTDGEQLTRVSPGVPIALNKDTLLQRTCPSAEDCRDQLFDRTTMEPIVDLVNSLSPSAALDLGDDLPPSGTLSPVAEIAIVRFGPRIGTGEGSTGEQIFTWMAVRTDTGAFVPIEPPDSAQPIVWADDGATAVYLSDGHLVRLDSTTLKTTPVSDASYLAVAEVR